MKQLLYRLRQKLFTALVILSLGMAVGCGVGKIGPLSLVGCEHIGSSGFELELSAPNRSKSTYTIPQAELTFHYEGAPLLKAQLRGEIRLEAAQENRITSRWKVQTNDPGALLLLERLLREGAFEALSVDYRIAFRRGECTKTFSAQMVPLPEFLCTFAPNDAQ